MYCVRGAFVPYQWNLKSPGFVSSKSKLDLPPPPNEPPLKWKLNSSLERIPSMLSGHRQFSWQVSSSSTLRHSNTSVINQQSSMLSWDSKQESVVVALPSRDSQASVSGVVSRRDSMKWQKFLAVYLSQQPASIEKLAVQTSQAQPLTLYINFLQTSCVLHGTCLTTYLSCFSLCASLS